MTYSSALPASFRHVRLLLAREAGHPDGDRDQGYDLLIPLDSDGKIEAIAWKKSQQHCRVRHFGPGSDDRVGRLRRKPGGQWYLDYSEGDEDDDPGFRLGEECFVLGEYISIGHADRMHTYQVARVEKP